MKPDKELSFYNVIIKKIKSSQNGIVSDAMERLGLKYETNYGVSIPVLKDIAQKYKPNKKLADLLSKSKIRETRILSFMIDDIKKLSQEDIERIIDTIDNHELAEQACTNFLDSIMINEIILHKMFNSNKEYIITTIYILYSRYAQNKKNLCDKFFEYCIQTVEKHSEKDSIHIRKAIARAMRTIALRNDYLKKKVVEQFDKLKGEKTTGINLIIEEVLPLIDLE